MRPIDADDLLDHAGRDRLDSRELIMDMINNAPTIELGKRYWIYPSDITGFGRCPDCNAMWNTSLLLNKFFRFCPRCASGPFFMSQDKE